MRREGISFKKIQQRLKDEDDVDCTRQAVSYFCKRHEESGTLDSKHGGGRRSLLAQEHRDFIDDQLTEDNELNGRQLQRLLEATSSIDASINTILRAKRMLGWKTARTRYCQMVREANKVKRLAFARQCLDSEDDFSDVIFVDETMIQMECHARRTSYKKGEPLIKRLRPRAKHPYSVSSCNVQLFCVCDKLYMGQILILWLQILVVGPYMYVDQNI